MTDYIGLTRDEAKSLLVAIEQSLPGMLTHPFYQALPAYEKAKMREHKKNLDTIKNKLNSFLKND